MCLENAKLSMRFDKEFDTYVGIGYKSGLTVDKGKVGEWYEAKSWDQKDKDVKDKGLDLVEVDNPDEGRYCEYPAGFHIFLEQKDAEAYGGVYADIYKVLFTDVVAFGDQYIIDSGKSQLKNCVITRWIKFERIVRKGKA